jgi:hypothetical protein
VPLEKTLRRDQYAGRALEPIEAHGDDGRWEDGDSHQQARLTAGTVAHNDKLSTDFRHDEGGGEGIERMWEREGSPMASEQVEEVKKKAWSEDDC